MCQNIAHRQLIFTPFPLFNLILVCVHITIQMSE